MTTIISAWDVSLLALFLCPGHDPKYEPDDENGRDKVINGFRFFVLESGDHGLAYHGHQGHTHEHADMEVPALEVRYFGVHEFDHEPQQQHGSQGRNDAAFHVAGDDVHYVLNEQPHDTDGETDKRKHEYEVRSLRKTF